MCIQVMKGFYTELSVQQSTIPYIQFRRFYYPFTDIFGPGLQQTHCKSGAENVQVFSYGRMGYAFKIEPIYVV